MYTPLKFMNQIETMVLVSGQPRLKNIANMRMLQTSEKFWKDDRASKFIKCKVEWNRLKNLLHNTEDFSEDVLNYEKYFTTRTDLIQTNTEDFLFQICTYLVYHDWRKNKRVYKIEENICHQLSKMKNPVDIPMKAIAYLPSKCFYIDYDGNCPFCDDVEGTFVTYDICDNRILWSLMHIIDNGRVYSVCTDVSSILPVRADKPLSAMTTSIDLSSFKMSYHSLTLEDGSLLTISDGKCVQFFVNFCLYLYAANNDVEYTERTKKIYKKTSRIQNRMREVEEFGVGFRNGQNISASKKKIRYTSTESADRVQELVVTNKRGYSSNYRSAHWHKYWVNDEENPGEKKIIVKWVEATFVHGNKNRDAVVVQRVTR